MSAWSFGIEPTHAGSRVIEKKISDELSWKPEKAWGGSRSPSPDEVQVMIQFNGDLHHCWIAITLEDQSLAGINPDDWKPSVFARMRPSTDQG